MRSFLASASRAALLCTCLLSEGAAAQTLPVPDALISLNSDPGAVLLLESEARQAYWPLSVQFVTQKNQAYCGVASIVMVLNALGVPAPSAPEFGNFRTFTQDNFFNEKTESVLPREVLVKKGMTLTQIGQLLETYSVQAEVRHASDTSIDDFRRLAAEHIGSTRQHVIVNYLRSAIGQERGGHISPLAAYDADTDRFLILDVSRYKYPPVWVRTPDLFAAMHTTDKDNENRSRGFVLVNDTPRM